MAHRRKSATTQQLADIAAAIGLIDAADEFIRSGHAKILDGLIVEGAADIEQARSLLALARSYSELARCTEVAECVAELEHLVAATL